MVRMIAGVCGLIMVAGLGCASQRGAQVAGAADAPDDGLHLKVARGQPAPIDMSPEYVAEHRTSVYYEDAAPSTQAPGAVVYTWGGYQPGLPNPVPAEWMMPRANAYTTTPGMYIYPWSMLVPQQQQPQQQQP